MILARKAIDTTRWLDEAEYSPSWQSRNQSLLTLIEGCGIDCSDLTYTEYGCGPFSPFTRIARSIFKYGCRADIKKWDEEVIQFDLNGKLDGLARTDIGVFSGVVEYLTDPKKTFHRMRHYHRRLLISYAHYDVGDNLIDRCVKNGWRNHFSLYDLTKVIAQFGYIENASEWERQTCLLIRHRNS